MIDLYYELNDIYIDLYNIENGKEFFIEQFEDREDLLIYIEKNFDYANLMILRR